MPYTIDALKRAIFPVLVAAARQRRVLSYKDCAKILERRYPDFAPINHRQMGHVVGQLMFELLHVARSTRRFSDVPPINSLVVNSNSGVPGEGGWGFFQHLLPDGAPTYERMSDDQKRRLAESIWPIVFDWDGWEDLLAERWHSWFTEEPPNVLLPAVPNGEINLGNGRGESEQHYNLKQYVAGHPEIFGNGYKHGHVEFPFPSLDVSDVLFHHKTRPCVVEVKSLLSGEDDLRRGVYQCVKYRALLEAECTLGRMLLSGKWQVRVALVTESVLPPKVRELCDLLGIEVFLVTVN